MNSTQCFHLIDHNFVRTDAGDNRCVTCGMVIYDHELYRWVQLQTAYQRWQQAYQAQLEKRR